MCAAKEPHAETLPGTRSAGRSGHPTCHTLYNIKAWKEIATKQRWVGSAIATVQDGLILIHDLEQMWYRITAKP
jgi:hypothetical protein